MSKKDIPVYMFTGMLESGKTSFVRDTLNDGEFEDGDKSLYILCEQGEVEIDPAVLKKNLITVTTIEEQSLFTEDYLNKLEEKFKPDRILLEVNGMWKPQELIDQFPENWMLVQCIALVDGSTFQTYMSAMGGLVMEQVKPADLVVFNRVDDEEDRGSYRRRVKALNRKAQILFEDEKGNLDDAYADTLPFDISGPVIDLEDDDFGLWYMDAMDHPEHYAGKKMRFHTMVYRHKSFPDDKLVPGRFAMTCCAADIQYIGFICHASNAKDFAQKSWVNVEADVKYEYCKDYKGKGIVLYADKPLEAAEPGEQLCYFT